MDAAFIYFNYDSAFTQLSDALRADILAVKSHKIFGALAENAGGLILAQNNIVTFNIDFQ